MKKHQETHSAYVTWEEQLEIYQQEIQAAEAEQAWQTALQEDQLLNMRWQEILAGEAELLAELLTAEVAEAELLASASDVILQDAGYRLQ